LRLKPKAPVWVLCDADGEAPTIVDKDSDAVGWRGVMESVDEAKACAIVKEGSRKKSTFSVNLHSVVPVNFALRGDREAWTIPALSTVMASYQLQDGANERTSTLYKARVLEVFDEGYMVKVRFDGEDSEPQFVHRNEVVFFAPPQQNN
jgi:hypothetical protein